MEASRAASAVVAEEEEAAAEGAKEEESDGEEEAEEGASTTMYLREGERRWEKVKAGEGRWTKAGEGGRRRGSWATAHESSPPVALWIQYGETMKSPPLSSRPSPRASSFGPDRAVSRGAVRTCSTHTMQRLQWCPED